MVVSEIRKSNFALRDVTITGICFIDFMKLRDIQRERLSVIKLLEIFVSRKLFEIESPKLKYI